MDKKFEILNYDELPKRGKYVNWSNIEKGFIFKTQHKDYGYNEFEFKKYEDSYLFLKYKNLDISKIKSDSFMNGKIGGIIRAITSNFKIEIGTKFKDKKRDLLITSREYRRGKNNHNKKWYKYTCNKCGWIEGWIREDHLNNGAGCSCCAGRTAVLGINTIWDTDRWMVSIIGEKFAKSNVCNSTVKVKPRCPICGIEKNKEMSINTIYNRKKVPCNVCGDGFNYTEKIMYNVLRGTGVDFTTQLSKTTFKWCNNYRYDFYIPSLNMIIETHGIQHYEEKSSNSKFNPLKEIQKNDRYKEKLAKENGIDHYIIIDCRKSELEWIKNNILNSELNNYFDFDEIDWKNINKLSLSSISYDIATAYKNNSNLTTVELADMFKISTNSVLKYLKVFSKNGYIDFDIDKVKKDRNIKGAKKAKLKNQKKIQVYKDGVFICSFDSIADVEKYSEIRLGVKLNSSYISGLFNKNNRHYGKKYKGFDIVKLN